jgi:hypothetical protein
VIKKPQPHGPRKPPEPWLHPIGPRVSGLAMTATTPGRRAQMNHKRHRLADYFLVCQQGDLFCCHHDGLVCSSIGELAVTLLECWQVSP